MNKLKIVLWLINNQKDLHHTRNRTHYISKMLQTLPFESDNVTQQKKQNEREEGRQEYCQEDREFSYNGNEANKIMISIETVDVSKTIEKFRAKQLRLKNQTKHEQ